MLESNWLNCNSTVFQVHGYVVVGQQWFLHLLWIKAVNSSANGYMAMSVHLEQYSAFFPLFIAAIAVNRAAFGQGTGPLLLYYLVCTGTESSLLSCSHGVVGVSSCSHYDDAGVVCPTCKLLGRP